MGRRFRLFCDYLFLTSPSFGVQGRLFFVIVSFTGYLTGYLHIVSNLPKVCQKLACTLKPTKV